MAHMHVYKLVGLAFVSDFLDINCPIYERF